MYAQIINQMNLFASSESNEGGEFRVVMPSFPADIVYEIGQSLETYCLEHTTNHLQLRYKVAYSLGQEWEYSEDPKVNQIFEHMVQKNWIDKENQLTQYRNEKRNPHSDDVLIIVLVGIDKVVDQSSLADFFCLDQEYIWKEDLQQKFSKWIEHRLKMEGSIAYENDQITQIDDFCIRRFKKQFVCRLKKSITLIFRQITKGLGRKYK